MKFKYLNLNIWNGGRLFDEVVEFIKKENADIVVLQEVNNGQDPSMKQRFQTYNVYQKVLPYRYHSFAPAFLDQSEGVSFDEGNAVFSRFPLTEVRNMPIIPYRSVNLDAMARSEYPQIPRVYQKVAIDLGEATVNVHNIHGIWGEDGHDSEARLKMSELIVKEIKNIPNVILSGDFNMTAHTQSINAVEKHLKNIFKDELKSSFNMRQKTEGGYAVAVVDMILVSQNIKVIDHYCLDVDVSDHLPLVTVLEVS